MVVDSHCHLDFPDLVGRLPEVLQRMRENQVALAVCIGVNLEDFPKVLALAEAQPNLYATVGVHPEYTDVEDPDLERLLALAEHPKVIAIGETGLDYYWQKDKPEWQRERFRTQIRAAKACGKPLVVHTRESAVDTLRLLKEEGADAVGGVMHCFTESWDIARQALDLGFHLSFSGIVTFKNALIVRLVSLAPDVCLTPSKQGVPVPYPITHTMDKSQHCSPNVFFQGKPAYLHNESYVDKVMGDEPGAGKGVVSQTNTTISHAIGKSGSVFVNGKPIVRTGDSVWMNWKAP